MLADCEKLLGLAVKLDEILRDEDNYKIVYNVARQRAEEEVRFYSECKDRAILGDKSARTYIVSQYSLLLASECIGVTQETFRGLIDFDSLENNSTDILFEMLLDIFDMSLLIEKYKLPCKISDSHIRQIAAAEEESLRMHYAAFETRLKMLSCILYASEYGQDCIDTLQHHNINEIGIIDKDYIYIVYKGVKYHLAFLRFSSSDIILNIQKKATLNSPVNYDEHNPSAVSSKANSSRVTAAGYGMTAGAGQLYYNERIFNLRKITLEELRDRYETINDAIYSFLVLNQLGKGSYYITGAEMGVGKSTFLQAMIEKVPDCWGIGVLDTQNELQLREKYPDKNIKTLIETPFRAISQCFEVMLKMARDIVIVGEVTRPCEVAEQVNASLRLNAGVGGTMHSCSPFEVITNMRNLLMRSDMYTNAEIAEADASRAIDIVIHLAKLVNGRIVVDSIVEVASSEITTPPELLPEGSRAARVDNLINLAQLALYKYLYRKSYTYRVLFRYNAELDSWDIPNRPSLAYVNKISAYLNTDALKKLDEIFANSGGGA